MLFGCSRWLCSGSLTEGGLGALLCKFSDVISDSRSFATAAIHTRDVRGRLTLLLFPTDPSIGKLAIGCSRTPAPQYQSCCLQGAAVLKLSLTRFLPRTMPHIHILRCQAGRTMQLMRSTHHRRHPPGSRSSSGGGCSGGAWRRGSRCRCQFGRHQVAQRRFPRMVPSLRK